jgi:hypothetical protein
MYTFTYNEIVRTFVGNHSLEGFIDFGKLGDCPTKDIW